MQDRTSFAKTFFFSWILVHILLLVWRHFLLRVLLFFIAVFPLAISIVFFSLFLWYNRFYFIFLTTNQPCATLRNWTHPEFVNGPQQQQNVTFSRTKKKGGGYVAIAVRSKVPGSYIWIEICDCNEIQSFKPSTLEFFNLVLLLLNGLNLGFQLN